MSKEILSLLMLHRIDHLGPVNARKIISEISDLSILFDKCYQKEVAKFQIPARIQNQFYEEDRLKNAERELEYCLKNDIELIPYTDTTYPPNLNECKDAPILLFKRGTFSFDQRPTISIVGTRKMTSYGKDFCKELIDEIKEFNPIIVSGFAYGVDIWAHRLALEAGLDTVAVLAHGFDTLYPAAHQKYMASVMEQGAFLSEFWHEEAPLRENFLRRNRIVAGISQATIVIESAQKGGSLVTADYANQYDREVFALSGKSTDLYSQGCLQLIKNHKAHLLSTPKDIIEGLQLNQPSAGSKKKQAAPIQRQLFVEMNADEQRIYNLLQSKGKQLMDHISLECELPTFKVASILLTMELKGLLRPHPGKVFEAI